VKEIFSKLLERWKMHGVCEYKNTCEDYYRNNHKCTDNTAFCALKIQLQMLAQNGAK
jgi:hypothetical protein